MKMKLHEIKKIKEGSKTYWIVQAPKGRISFNKKKDAVKWVESFR